MIKKGFAEYVRKEDPDIICLQETKIHESKVVDELVGYHKKFLCASKPGQHGTA